MGRDRTLPEQAFDQFPQALVIVDREATVLSLNAAAERLTGWSRSSAAGRPAADILEIRTETGVNFCAPNGELRRTLRLGTSVNTHFAYLFKLRTTDAPVRVSYTVSPLKGPKKEVTGAVIAIHDVTPELETIEARDALMLAASHELKTPMTTLKGLSELLLDYELSESQRRELLADLHGQADRMERLIEDILDVSRIDSGRLSVDLSRVEVAPLLEHVRDEVKSMLQGKRLRTDVPDNLPAVWAEGRKLSQILINLVTNAIKYSAPGSQITIRVRGDGENVRFEVSDQGIGIRKEHQARLFERFYRADDPIVRRTPGNGLGLYIVRSLVNMLGGQIQVRSAYGKGSVFTVSLPRAQTSSGRQPLAAAAGR
jgi:PAS domain S-box-containing protein